MLVNKLLLAFRIQCNREIVKRGNHPAQLETIGQLSEQLQNATDLTDIENKLSALINKMEAGGESLQTTETGSAS